MAGRWVAICAGLAALGASSVRSADLEFFTGDALYAQCASKPADGDYASRQARCAGYVLGVSDAQQASQGAGRAGRVCLPSTAGSPQLVDTVSRFLETHADKRQLAAQDLVLDALSAQYPCR